MTTAEKAKETSKEIILTNEEIELLLRSQSQTGEAPLIRVMNKSFWPVKVSYWLGRVQKSIESLAKDFQEKKSELINKYAKRDEGGEVRTESNGNVIFENITDFNKDFSELLSIEVPTGINKIKIDPEEIQERIDKKGENMLSNEWAIVASLFELEDPE